MQVGTPAKATPNWTLGDKAGSVTSVLEATLTPPEAGSVDLDGNLVFTQAASGATVSFKGDNGGKGGLTITSEPFDVEPAAEPTEEASA